uniref:Uncharacterized protein n=1 Tax=Parascaris equorum TaxID=6256 RepID=A0A914REW6_PAREQ
MSHKQDCIDFQVQEPCGSIIEDVDDVTLSGAILYKPKVIVILSRFPFFELFRIGFCGIYIVCRVS